MSYIYYTDEQMDLLANKIIPFMYCFGFEWNCDRFNYVRSRRNHRTRGTAIRRIKHNVSGKNINVPFKVTRYFDSQTQLEITKEIYPVITNLYFDAKKFMLFVDEKLNMNMELGDIRELWNQTNYTLEPDLFFKVYDQLFSWRY